MVIQRLSDVAHCSSDTMPELESFAWTSAAACTHSLPYLSQLNGSINSMNWSKFCVSLWAVRCSRYLKNVYGRICTATTHLQSELVLGSHKICSQRDENKKLNCRKETMRLLRGTVLAKYNWKTIFCGHYRSVINQCDVIGLQSYRIWWNNTKWVLLCRSRSLMSVPIESPYATSY